MRFLYYLPILFFITISCKKEAKENPKPIDPITGEPAKTGSFSVEFQALVGTNNLVYGTQYTNEKGEPFKVDLFQYYVSNFKLKKPDGSVVALPDLYYLVQAEEGKDNITIPNVPVGTYSGISFDIGIDSTRNVSGAQTGALDPANANGMFWNWNSGYVFLMLNGTSDSSKAAGNNFFYHISGFKKSNYAIKTISQDFPMAAMDVKANSKPNVHYYVNLLEFFKNPSTLSIASLNTIHMPGANAMLVAENYKDMFKLDHVEN